MPAPIHVAVGVVTRGSSVLICQRASQDPHPGKWEFPGGKVQDGEDERSCLQRELHEELGIDATIGAFLYRTTHTYPQGRTVVLTFFHVPSYRGEIANTQFQQLAWVEPGQLPTFDFLEGDREFIAALARGEWPELFVPEPGRRLS
ncbi:MAG: (deoxy)nucleoside triphosphate pyrophosphohydrolase [Candidatus Binatia bacterium]|nr:(deoxy)nucleoside triphosphate pyrophosphohydrolase [Candidatus Binatia bacterium]